MSSTHQLKLGYCSSPNTAMVQWIKHNQEVNRTVKTLQNQSRNGGIAILSFAVVDIENWVCATIFIGALLVARSWNN